MSPPKTKTKTPKPFNFLTDTPREIRNQIYETAFQTPYDSVTYRCTRKNTYQILAYDPQNDECLTGTPLPALGLLSTCAQIHREAVVSLWRVNSLGLWPADLLFRLRGLGGHVFAHVQSMQINVDLGDGDDLKWAEMLFARMGGNWRVRDEGSEGEAWGGLRMVQINPLRTEARKMDVRWMQRVAEAMHLRWESEELRRGENGEAVESWGLYAGWMDLFRQTRTPGSEAYLGDAVRRVVNVNTAWDEWTYQEQGRWVNKLRHGADVREMEQVMKDLHQMFGGELWANGKLCYKERKRLKRVFEVKPVEARPLVE
ncbi:hypothetical protein EYC84_001341 [Monilinia fructicola]|uniref:Uncharacterized protein n=1 Tax=Monilinia fructicola TaxID=38448 RepID=A0A5M9JP32_MONFR|nr:hypothetical protein EYC84_001341 [Monilinia fructicola]